MSNARCNLCRKPAADDDHLCVECRAAIVAVTKDLPPLQPDVIAKVVRLLRSE